MTAVPYKSKSNNYIHIGEEHPEIMADAKTIRGEWWWWQREAWCHYTTHFQFAALIATCCFVGVDTAELEMGDNLKINLNLNRQSSQNNDITYLVRNNLPLCKCAHTVLLLYYCINVVTAFGMPQNLCYISTHAGQTLLCKSVSSDLKQRSIGEKWPLQGKRSGADFPDSSCYQGNGAIIPHHSLLPYQWQWSGVRLCLGGCQGHLHGLGETLTHCVAEFKWVSIHPNTKVICIFPGHIFMHETAVQITLLLYCLSH